jgi:hypothetical protein
MSTLESLKSGAINVSDITLLEQLDTEQLVDELSTYYQIQFLDRRVGKKWEVGLAKDRVNDDFHRCLMLTSERGHLTTIAVMACLQIQESLSSPGIYEMTSGGGFSLYRTPDGWRIKSLDEKRVSLKRDSLKKRGWLFAS